MSRSPLRRRANLRTAAFASVSLACLALAAPTPASAQLLTALGGGTATGSNPVKPYYGNISPFYGNLSPFYGNISPFYGNLSPFYGNLKPFWGNLQPFWGDTNAFYGDLSTFWGQSVPQGAGGAPNYLSIGNFWTVQGNNFGTLFSAWNASGTINYASIDTQLKTIVDSSRSFWGSAVQTQTGQSFDAAFGNKVLSKYGINLADPNSLKSLDQTHQALFFLDWYDGLMNYSGADHVDWWMKSVNWTPAVTQQQGYGTHTMVGLLDQTVTGDGSIAHNIIRANGVSDFTDGHGVAVASLILGPQDGKGVMGIAPGAQVIAYNPYDSTGTAGWSDIINGVQNLKAGGANVVNASLGVPGITFDQGWNTVFTDLKVALTLKNTVFVMAAGNDGVSQTKNISWTPLLTPAFIVVGSVGLDGTISNFSNRPGSACLVPLLGLCTGDYLRNHFIVAPGELILTSDGNGGTTRVTGTSLAAPLVSGAIALLQNRWPWLQNYPNETVQIILRSAKDLGAPGVDPVYGWGELDVTASQSPLNFNNLTWYTVQNGQMTAQTRQAVLTTYQSAQQQTWNATNAYFYAFESIGATQRDFAIPLSSKLIGQNVTTANGSQEQFQAYLLSRMDAWATSQGYFTASGQTAAGGFHFAAERDIPVANRWGADMTLSLAPKTERQGFVNQGPAYQSTLAIRGERAGLMFGFGDGAPKLSGAAGFGQASDYDSERGGANPLLGLASGGGFAAGSLKLSPTLEFSAGVLAREDRRDPNLLPALHQPGVAADVYQAGAQVMSLSWRPSDALTFGAGYTRLHEARGLLGIQSLDPADFAHGSTTDGLTLSANWALTPKLSLMATGTLGRTQASDHGQQLAVAKGGLETSAYAVGLKAADLFAGGDRLQLMLSQPMFVERGHLTLTGVEVVDRTTGELGVVTHPVDIAGQRRVAGEAVYSLPTNAGFGYVALFGRAETQTDVGQPQAYMAGARYRLAF
jgi:hypothetical protein